MMMTALMIRTILMLAIISTKNNSIDNNLLIYFFSRFQIGGDSKQVPKTRHDCWGEGDGYSRVTSKVSIRVKKYSIC